MSGGRKPGPPGNDDRPARIAAIVEAVVAQWHQGSTSTVEEVAAAHPDLRPELGEQLRTAYAIFLASQKARRESFSDDSASAGHELLEGEIAYLQQHLTAYQILAPIEHGGQGAVYKAVQRSTGRVVAIKVLLDGPYSSPRRKGRFKREIEIVSRLEHPNIVTIFDCGQVAGRPYYAMRFVEGEPIDAYVFVHRPGVPERVRLFAIICRAVAHAHQRGVIHRDLKPLNILVDLEGAPHILDFGLAKLLEEESDPASMVSQTGQVIGTLHYLSPEQARGDVRDVDTLSDVYTLGVIFYRLLTGVFPYPVHGDPETIRRNIQTREPLSLRRALRSSDSDTSVVRHDIGDDLETIILKALSKEKNRRYQSAAALADDLEYYLAGKPIQARADSAIYMLKKTLRRYRLPVAVASAFVLMLAVSAVLIGLKWREAAAQRDNARAATRLAHATFEQVVNEMEQSVRALAGGTEVRDRLLDGVADKLARLQRRVEGDEAMTDLLIALAEKRGDLAVIRGREDEARRHYTACLRLGESPAAPPPSVGNLVIARAHRKLATLGGQTSAKHYQRAIDTCRTLIAREPEGNEARLELCTALFERARRSYNEGKTDQALTDVQEARKLTARRSGPAGAELAWNDLAARIYMQESLIWSRVGEGARRAEAMQRSLELREKLCRAYPTNVELRQALRTAHLEMGRLERERGRSEAALIHLRRALDIGRYLMEVEPSCLLWKHEQLRALETLTKILLARNELEEADHSSIEAFLLTVELVEQSPNDDDLQRALAFAYSLRSDVARASRDWRTAVTLNAEAARIHSARSMSNSDNLAAKSELAGVLGDQAKCLRKRERLKEALELAELAVQIRRELAEAAPSVAHWSILLVSALNNLATIHLADSNVAGSTAATRILQEAQVLLDCLEQDGRLIGQEARRTELSHAIRKNLEIAARRAARYSVAKASQDAPDAQP